jgi:hypothetical protein
VAVKNCASCGKPMNASAATCPHCAVRQPGFDATAARKGLSPDEIRALLLTDTALRAGEPHSEGLFSTLVVPHAATTGLSRTLEVVLTIACAPLILAGLIALGLRRSVARNKITATSGELTPIIVMTVFGALPLQFILGLLDVAGATQAWIILGSIGGLFVRGALRARAASARSGELLRVEK